MNVRGLLIGLLVGLPGMLCAQSYPTALMQQANDTAACRKWVDERMSQMTLKQKIGQLFVYKLAPNLSQTNKTYLTRAVKEYGVGGLLFSGGEVEKQVALTNYAQRLSKVPVMVTFDGEWGLGMRLKQTPSFPRNRILGCIQEDSLIYRYGKEVARQLREIGVHVNFAPVADVDNNPKNPVINTRSFGSGKENVARKVIAYSRGLEDGGVLAVCKHFPGHGDTEVDSHYALPVLSFDRTRLDTLELFPFRKAVESGIGGVMVGHLKVTCLDNKPASVSPKVIRDLLVGEMGFSGLVFTDAMEMKGLSKYATDLCVSALKAGNDLLLSPGNLKKEVAEVYQAVKAGKISEEEITRKCRKVLTYKYLLGLSDYRPVKEEGLMERIETPETLRLMKELDRAAVTVVKDSADLLPLDLSLSGNVLLSVSKTLTEAHPFYQELKKWMPLLTWMRANPDSLRYVEERIRPAQRVIVALHEKELGTYRNLVRRLSLEKPVVVVCFQPHAVLQKEVSTIRQAATVILAHNDGDDVQRYVAEVLLGKAFANGKLSVKVEGGWPEGTGIVVDPDHPRSYLPEDFNMDAKVLERIDSLALEGIREKAYPGCQILILKEGYPVYHKCFGKFTYEGEEEVHPGSVYDLASLSKAAGTLLAVMKLYDEGKIVLTDKVSRYLPVLQHTDKENITIQQLLYHESGLPAYLPFYLETVDMKKCPGGLFRRKPDRFHTNRVGENLYACTEIPYKEEWVARVRSDEYSLPLSDSLFLKNTFPGVILGEIAKAPLKSRTYRYSCLNFMLLKEMVEQVAGVPMDVYLDSLFYRPMGLSATMYCPLKRIPKKDIVPTVTSDFLRGTSLRGIVHDEAAAFMGGVSGNAGLFSTASDLGVIFQMLLDKGICGDQRYLSRATCELFTTMKSKASRRGLGFDRPDAKDPDQSPCAAEAPAAVFGHTGFTGTCVWADPENELVFVFLSNRIYPEVYGSRKLMQLKIRERMQQTMYQSLMR